MTSQEFKKMGRIPRRNIGISRQLDIILQDRPCGYRWDDPEELPTIYLYTPVPTIDEDIAYYRYKMNSCPAMRESCTMIIDLLLATKMRIQHARSYPKENLDDIKAIPIMNFINHGAVVWQNSDRAKLSCPFHEEHTPSFVVFKKDNRFWCFGGCGGGTVIDFIMKKEGLTFKEALKYLKNG